MLKSPDSKGWIAAEVIELRMLMNNEGMTLVRTPPSGFKVTTSTIVCIVKKLPTGRFEKYKVRLCPRGCDQLDSY